MQGVPSIPPPTFSTFTTVVDPPTPLPAIVHAPPQSAAANPVSAGTTAGPTQMRVPYPSAAAAEPPRDVTSTNPVPTTSVLSAAFHKPQEQVTTLSAQQQHADVPKKMALAPTSSKGFKSKRTFKVIIVGDAGVGKTCLSFRFCCGRFPEHTEATIGVDFRERNCVIEKELLKVQLWDTAGQERYRQSIVAHYYRNVNAVVFVYDVTCKTSFESLRSWISECEKHGLTADSEVPRILIGNKCDLPGEERVNTDVAQMFADRNNMALFETSAKAESEADHVESIFLTLLHKLQHSRPMHVQSPDERNQGQEKLVLTASERAQMEDDGFADVENNDKCFWNETGASEKQPVLFIQLMWQSNRLLFGLLATRLLVQTPYIDVIVFSMRFNAVFSDEGSVDSFAKYLKAMLRLCKKTCVLRINDQGLCFVDKDCGKEGDYWFGMMIPYESLFYAHSFTGLALDKPEIVMEVNVDDLSRCLKGGSVKLKLCSRNEVPHLRVELRALNTSHELPVQMVPYRRWAHYDQPSVDNKTGTVYLPYLKSTHRIVNGMKSMGAKFINMKIADTGEMKMSSKTRNGDVSVVFSDLNTEIFDPAEEGSQRNRCVSSRLHVKPFLALLNGYLFAHTRIRLNMLSQRTAELCVHQEDFELSLVIVDPTAENQEDD